MVKTKFWRVVHPGTPCQKETSIKYILTMLFEIIVYHVTQCYQYLMQRSYITSLDKLLSVGGSTIETCSQIQECFICLSFWMWNRSLYMHAYYTEYWPVMSKPFKDLVNRHCWDPLFNFLDHRCWRFDIYNVPLINFISATWNKNCIKLAYIQVKLKLIARFALPTFGWE